jgi:hypothetical protein
MVANPFFRLKIARLKATVCTSIYQRKNRFPRSGRFCLRLRAESAVCGIPGKVPWHIALWRPRYANGRPNHWANCHSRGNRRRVVAKSAGSIENQFLHRCGTLRTVALRRPIFKQKKGSASISLGLNYCSMGSSQSPSHDPVLVTNAYFPLKDSFVEGLVRTGQPINKQAPSMYLIRNAAYLSV